jgi:hypothetical protein
MDEDRFQELSNTPTPSAPPNRGVWAAVIVLICAVAVSLAYAFRERHDAEQLAASQDQMSSALNQTRGQVDSLSAQLSDMSSRLAVAQQAQQNARQAATPSEGSPSASHATRRRARTSREDPRIKKMQAQLDDEQKQIASTRDDLDKARTELEGNLSSTRDELNGSIAKNHEELVALEKRGQRDYFEFDLNKSKRYQHVGPMSLSLRKTSTKHDQFNLVMLVDDKEVSRKNVNLYEPMLFYPPDSAAPLEVVVNQIGKDHVHGYLSAPKYRKSELTSLSVDTNGQTPSTPETNSGSKPESSSTPGPISSNGTSSPAPSSPSSEADASLDRGPAPQF